MSVSTVPSSAAAGWSRGLAYVATSIAVLFLIVFTVLEFSAVRALQGVETDIHSVSTEVQNLNSHLATLQTMSDKLDRLASVSSSLVKMEGQLDETVGILRTADTKFDGLSETATAMQRPLDRLESDIRTLDGMRDDIHKMAQTMSHSFLLK